MKVLLINGSPHINGCTARALKEVATTLEANGVETETIQVGSVSIRGCTACKYCYKNSKCVYDDLVNEVALKFEYADGIVVGSPVYYASPNGNLLSFLDRLFYSTRFSKTMKVGASVVSCRRGGASASFDALNKYFTISSMPIVSSTYWNQVHGSSAQDVEKDEEGLQTMRNLGTNMAYLIKGINLIKEKEGLPQQEKSARTDFSYGK